MVTLIPTIVVYAATEMRAIVRKFMYRDDVMISLKAQLHGSQFWRQFFLKSASRFQYSNLIGCVHANYDVIVNILGVHYLENRRTHFRATAPLMCYTCTSVCVIHAEWFHCSNICQCSWTS